MSSAPRARSHSAAQRLPRNPPMFLLLLRRRPLVMAPLAVLLWWGLIAIALTINDHTHHANSPH